MELQFVYDQPAAFLGDALLIADVHLGIEFELQKKGYNLPLQYRQTAEKVNALIRETKARQVVFLGDVKHNVYGMEDTEERMLNAFFRLLKTKRITVCKGNHDSFIENCTGITVAPAEGMVLEDTLLWHGHATPDAKLLKSAKSIACGHEHPLAQIGEGRHTWTEKAWIIGKQGKHRFVVFPHFGDLVGGRAYRAESHLVRFLDTKACRDADVHLLSGVKLGKVKELHVREND